MKLALVLPRYEPFGAANGALAIIARHLALELGAVGIDAVVVGPAPSAPWDHGVSARLVAGPSSARRVVDRLIGRAGSSDPGGDRYASTVIDRLSDRDHVVVLNDLDLAVGVRSATGLDTRAFAQNETEPTRVDDAAVRGLTGLLACSPYIREWLVGRFAIDPALVRVVPNGVDLDGFRPSERPDRDELVGVFVGRIDPNKGILELLQATVDVRARGVRFTLQVAGPVAAWDLSPDETEAFVDRFHELLAAAGAGYLGPVDRESTARLMGSADLVFVPSLSQEPFGLVAAEALASGAAVVVSDRGGLPWIVADAGVVVEPTAVALSSAITSLVADGARRARLGAAARERAGQFSWSCAARELLDALA